MIVEAFTPKGKVLLDLDKAEDVAIFGGQKAVDNYITECLIQKQINKTARAAAIAELKTKEA